MKAIFKGHLVESNPSDSEVYFTVGKIYDLIPSEVVDGFYNVRDDKGFTHLIRPNKLGYDFEVLIPDGSLSCSELFDDAYGYELMVDEISNKPKTGVRKELRYCINDTVVDKGVFDDALSCFAELESMGVDTSSIKFEVKFE